MLRMQSNAMRIPSEQLEETELGGRGGLDSESRSAAGASLPPFPSLPFLLLLLPAAAAASAQQDLSWTKLN